MLGFFLDPGTLRHELSLQSAQRAEDGAGGFTETWMEVATVFGRIDVVGENSFYAADQMLERVTHRITIRHRDDVASGMRFEKAGRTFLIMTITDPDETGRYLVCRTQEQGR